MKGKKLKTHFFACAIVSLAYVYVALRSMHEDHFSKVASLARTTAWTQLHGPQSPRYLPSKQCIPLADLKSNETGNRNHSDLAFVFGGLVGYAKLEAFKCVLAIESLAKIAKYDGEIYLITERQEGSCFPTEEELRKKVGSEKVNVIYTSEHTLEGTWKGDDRSRSNMRAYLQDMSIKMDIFHYLPFHISVAAWYDCDVVFAVYDCATRNLLCAVPEFSEKFPLYNTWGWHVGSFMAHRKYSSGLLREWKEEFLTGKYVSDYPALKVVYERQNTSDINNRWRLGHFVSGNFTTNSYSNDQKVLTSDAEAGEQYSSWRDVIWDKTTPNSCIMHLTQGRCAEANNGPIATDALVRSLGLSSPASVKYCSGTPRKIILQQGLSNYIHTCRPPPADFVYNKHGGALRVAAGV